MKYSRILFYIQVLGLVVFPLATFGSPETIEDPALSTQPIALNQVGYGTDSPKRFTAPHAENGTRFIVRHADSKADSSQSLFVGKIEQSIGDFSAFRPKDTLQRFVVALEAKDGATITSDPFLIRSNLYQEQFWQPAVDFLIDSRSAVGTHASAYGGTAWRDGTYYDSIIPALVLFYLADPERVKAMPRQIDWEADKRRALDPAFKFNSKDRGAKDVMETVKAYYQLAGPAPDAPDVVKLIHWGAGYSLQKPATHEPAGDPAGLKVHSQTIEQVAYVVWAWPALKEWLPESFYRQCLELCLRHWEPSLEIDPMWDSKSYSKNPAKGAMHPFKGRHAPGHSIVPNLLMHEVAKREGRDDAARYLQAAVKQAEWCIKNLDWNDPRTTKGHRMSEHRTIPNLVWLLQNYPDAAPTGLKQKIDDWADVALSRSGNMWDFRRFDMDQHWTIPSFNDVGNSLSLPAIATAASWVLDDPKKVARLEMMGTAALDHVFGRNPRLAAAPANPTMGFPEIERGWPKHYKKNICARLELCRGSISSAPGSEMFPFNPKGEYRHPEGWVNYGASWCISLAYLQFNATGARPELPASR